MKKTFLLSILILWGALSASAQLYRYLETKDGLSSRRVIAIEKDNKGYMWFLTQEGIDRYNGKQFKFYPLTDGKLTLQQFPNLNQLHIDLQDDIWITGKNGYVFKYNRGQDKYDLIMNFADSLKTTRRLPLTYTGLDRNDQLWLCTRNEQYIYFTQSGKTVRLDSPIKEEITYIEQGKGNRYFIGTNQSIIPAQLKGNRIIPDESSILEGIHRIQHIHYHVPTDRLLIGTMADGFYVYDLRTHTLQNIGQLKDVTMNEAIDAHPSAEEVLIATDGNGVFRLNMHTLDLRPFLSTNQREAKMNGDIIKDIQTDEEGRLWMAVFPISITVYSDKYPKYHWLNHEQKDTRSLASNQITNVIEDSDGDIWVATSNGVGCYHRKTQQWTNLLSDKHPDRQKQNYVYISLCEATPGTILVGGYMSGMYSIDKKNMRPKYFSPQAEGYTSIRPDKYIRSIYRDEDGTIWAGGYYNFKEININKNIEHYQIDYPITVITSKNKHELWVGTVNGIYKFNKRQKKLQQVNLSPSMGTINSILQIDSTLTYIGTHGSGLWIYNNQTGKLENYHTENSALISNNIFCILPSTDSDELIISTENELVCFNTRKRTFLNWTQEQGMLTDKFNTSAGIRTRSGDIIFGSDDGLVIIQDSINLPADFHSKLIFNDLHIRYQRMLPGMEDSPLTKPIDDTQSITLTHKQNIFSLEVSSINYDCPSRILYSWKLEGFYDEWTVPGETNVIRYTNLTPGDYTLRVRAILLDDGKTMEERSLRIHIEPPFSQTGWAFLIYVLLILLIISAILRYLWLRKDSMLSREKIRFFINTAHDIRTPLTLIKGPLNEIDRNEKLSETGKEHLQNAIQNTDHLSKLATQLIEFQKEELYSSETHVSVFELNSYIRQFIEPFQAYANQKNQQLSFEGTEGDLNVWIDSHKMDSILRNLLSNALKYTPEGGKISLHLKEHRKEWTLTISDTGIGIPTKDQRKMFRHLFRGENVINQQITGTGIGMLQTYRLVRRHQGKITMTSQENEGTTFHLRFPKDSKLYLRTSEEKKPNRIQDSCEVQNETHNGQSTTATHIHHENNVPHLLIVEDNKDLRQFLRRSLSNEYRISEAENGQEALAFIKQEHPSLIVSDIMMPEMRGDDLCQALKTNVETSHIPIILLTALGDRESILHGLRIKADSYVVKPFDMDILKANIASVLANKEFIRRRFSLLDYRTEDLPKEVQEDPGLSLDQEFLTKATKLVLKNLGEEFNVDDLCLEMGMSRSSLYNKVKALTGHSPSEFVRRIRMKEAAALLKSKKHTVSEVSDMMGYSDPKYFTDIFKKHYGMTPSAYMKQP